MSEGLVWVLIIFAMAGCTAVERVSNNDRDVALAKLHCVSTVQGSR